MEYQIGSVTAKMTRPLCKAVNYNIPSFTEVLMAASFQLGKMSKLITVTRKEKNIIQHTQQGIKARSLQQHVGISANLSKGDLQFLLENACSLEKLMLLIYLKKQKKSYVLKG